MSDIVCCNKEQAEKILKAYFSIPPIVTSVSKDDDNIYFIQVLTIPGLNRTEWQYRPWKSYHTDKIIGACFGEIYKGDRRYNLHSYNNNYTNDIINETFKKAIDRYERGCDIFQVRLLK